MSYRCKFHINWFEMILNMYFCEKFTLYVKDRKSYCKYIYRNDAESRNYEVCGKQIIIP